jgi:1-acyl-sn-glycerol-3-phosphate acyltransferase
VRALVAALMERDLRRAFRRVCWVGPLPQLPDGEPVVIVTNHHSSFDGHLVWLLARRMLRRRFLVWMEDWDRFPFFGLQGALPFPTGDDVRRAATMRRTRRLLAVSRSSVLAYFAEGRLHRPEKGVDPFDADNLSRIHRVLGSPRWWSLGIHVTSLGDARPTALLAGGTVQTEPDGRERTRLESLLALLRQTDSPRSLLFDGRPGPEERWSFSWVRGLFRMPS